jgi:hypothetical protein
LESRINNLGPLEPKITCRSEKESFNPEIRQQWQQSRLDTSAEDFAQAWNLLCNFRTPSKTTPRINNLDQIDQNLDDIEDFVGYDISLEDNHFEELQQEVPIRRRQVSLCRHKLQTRAYPKFPKIKKVWRSSEPKPEPETTDLDRKWLQLIQLEKAIEKQKNQLLEAEAGDRGDPDADGMPFNENEEDLAKRYDHLDDGDLEYINSILNSFSSPTCYRQGSRQLKLKSITPEDAPARVDVTDDAARI